MKLFTRNALLIFLFTLVSFTVKGQITASFTADVTSGCAPLVVHFTNTSTGAITSYYWDFGTGTTSVLKDPSTSFTTPGTYIVSLTVYGPGGPVTTTMTITVYPPPTVSFTSSATSVCPGTPVTFTSTTIGGVPGTITYTWSFGDGGISTATTPIHIYSTSGYFNVTLTATNSMGCVASVTIPKYMFVFTPAVPDFTGSSTYLCKAPGTVTFTNLTTGTPGFTYAWDFGDGGTSVLTSPSHTYTASGSFDVKLTVTDGNGCTSLITKTGYVNIGNIKAGFTSVSTACINTLITFTNTSTKHSSSKWDYGDGGTDTTNTGSHSYKTTGTYKVRLIVKDSLCYDTVTNTIIIITGPTASFTFSPLQPCPPPSGVTFTATAPPGTLFTWVFGRIGTGTGSPITFTFPADSVYLVTMTAKDPVTGCISTDTGSVIIFDRFWHHIEAHPDSGCRPLTVSFRDTSASHIPWSPGFSMGYPYLPGAFTWTFGDGATSTSIYPTHTYTTVGAFSASVSIVTTNGCIFRDTVEVLVGDPPTMTASCLTTEICYGQPIVFTKKIVKGPVDLFLWTFDSLGTYHDYDTTSDTVRYRPVPGIFSVTVTPSYHGCPGTPVALTTIIVDSPKAAYNLQILCSPHNRVQFSDSSWGDDIRTWVFGDGTTSSVRNPLHDYPTGGTFKGYIAAYNSKSGCRDTANFMITLLYPTIDFTATKTAMCIGGIDTFTATVTGGFGVGYTWDSGGTFPWPPYYLTGYKTGYEGPVTTDTFHIPGIYTIRLIVMDQNFCFDTVIKTNYIRVSQPVAKFTATPATGCWPLAVTFTDASTDPSGISLSKYIWAFGDGATSTVTTASVAHTFTATGSFTTQEFVSNYLGCRDSVKLPLVTVWRNHAAFYASNLFPCINDSTHFFDTTSGVTSSFWTFGDGGTSTALSPWHTYTATGSYTVTLAIVGAHGCRDTAVFVNYITVTQVFASFNLSDTFSICPPLIVNFTNTSIGATGFNWDLGDGGISTAPNPSELYIKPGFYTIVLIDSNIHGCKDTATAHVNIYGYAGALSYSPLKGCAPLKVHFKAKISNVPSIIWDFSDGTTSASSTIDSIDYTYVSAGSYVPKLILSDLTGCENSSIGLDTIKVDKVYPDFTTVPDPVCVNAPVNFKDKSRSYFSTITTWGWTFNNGDVSSLSSPPYLYTTVGTYPVNLVVTDGWGCIDSISKDVVVNPLPTITTSPDTIICLTDAATLTGYGAVSYTWIPAVTVSCTNCNPTKASPAVVTTYTVTGTDINGCANTDTVTVFLKTKTVSHASGEAEICRNVIVQLHDSGGTSYTWIPGTGLSDPTATEPFASPDFTTKYMAIAHLGRCIPDTEFIWINVHQLPTVDAGASQRLVEGSTAQLQATGSLIQKYSWTDPATLSCDSCSNPLATMSVTTTYHVFVTSDFGCKAADSVTIHIYCDKSQIFIPNSFTPNGDGQNDVFYPRGKGVSIIKSFRIYNRWGQLLFERSDIQINDASNAWDGSYMGGTIRPDVYVYVLDALCETGEPLNLKGDVTIIR